MKTILTLLEMDIYDAIIWTALILGGLIVSAIS